MSLQTITNGFEIIINSVTSTVPFRTSAGDLVLAVAFAILCEIVKRASKKVNPCLEYGSDNKFHDVVWKTIVRMWLTYYSITLCLSKDYFWDTSLYWRHADGRLRGNYCRRDLSSDERLYYVFLFGYYLNHTITQFNDPKRKDFWALCAHHVITLLLILISYNSGYTSIGVVLGMCHEPSDLLLSVAKICRYLGMKTTGDVTFFAFVISWLYFRLYVYPVKCLIPTGFGAWHHFYHDYLPVPVDDPPNCSSLTVSFLFSLMVILYLLHFYWTYFVLKALFLKLLTGIVVDTRSDNEGQPSKED